MKSWVNVDGNTFSCLCRSTNLMVGHIFGRAHTLVMFVEGVAHTCLCLCARMCVCVFVSCLCAYVHMCGVAPSKTFSMISECCLDPFFRRWSCSSTNNNTSNHVHVNSILYTCMQSSQRQSNTSSTSCVGLTDCTSAWVSVISGDKSGRAFVAVRKTSQTRIFKQNASKLVVEPIWCCRCFHQYPPFLMHSRHISSSNSHMSVWTSTRTCVGIPGWRSLMRMLHTSRVIDDKRWHGIGCGWDRDCYNLMTTNN